MNTGVQSGMIMHMMVISGISSEPVRYSCVLTGSVVGINPILLDVLLPENGLLQFLHLFDFTVIFHNNRKW
jgi:hypothetical protein